MFKNKILSMVKRALCQFRDRGHSRFENGKLYLPRVYVKQLGTTYLSLKSADALPHKRCRISGFTSFRVLKGYRLLQDIYKGKNLSM